MYDVVRVDHFRGFDEYYSIPAGSHTAVHGTWRKGPGMDIFRKMQEKFGKLNIIAEDLGFLTPSVLELVKDTGFPGMKVLEFAFDSREEVIICPITTLLTAWFTQEPMIIIPSGDGMGR